MALKINKIDMGGKVYEVQDLELTNRVDSLEGYKVLGKELVIDVNYDSILVDGEIYSIKGEFYSIDGQFNIDKENFYYLEFSGDGVHEERGFMSFMNNPEYNALYYANPNGLVIALTFLDDIVNISLGNGVELGENSIIRVYEVRSGRINKKYMHSTIINFGADNLLFKGFFQFINEDKDISGYDLDKIVKVLEGQAFMIIEMINGDEYINGSIEEGLFSLRKEGALTGAFTVDSFTIISDRSVEIHA